MDRICRCKSRKYRRGVWRMTPYPAIGIVESSPINSEGNTTASVRIDEPISTPGSDSVFQTIQSEREGPSVRRLIENSRIAERIELQRKREEVIASSAGQLHSDILSAAAKWNENNLAIDTERSQRSPKPSPRNLVRRRLIF